MSSCLTKMSGPNPATKLNMAHECPDCGSVCYCGGDIDDCVFNFDDDVDGCTHFKICDAEEEDFDDGA